MAITLADAQINALTDLDFAVIDDLRRRTVLMDRITFDDVVSPTGGSTFVYGYTRLKTAAPAQFRAIGSEYTPGEAEREQVTTQLAVLGGAFNLDRVIANLGQAATNERAFQFSELTKSVVTKFQEALITGDTNVDANGFDGLDTILTGTSTELGTGVSVDWTAGTINSETLAHGVIDQVDELLDAVEGGADVIMGNSKSIARVRSIGRRAGYYTRSEDALGRQVERYGPALLVDLGQNVAGTGSIIPVETRDPDGAGGGGNVTGLTDLYAVRFGLDAFHAASAVGQLLRTYQPPAGDSGAVQLHELEMAPVAAALRSTRAAAVLRNVKVQ